MTKKRPSFASLKRDLHLRNFLFRQASAAAAAAAASTSSAATTPTTTTTSSSSSSTTPRSSAVLETSETVATTAKCSLPATRSVSTVSAAARFAELTAAASAAATAASVEVGRSYSNIPPSSSSFAAVPPITSGHNLHGRRESFLYRSSFDEHDIAPCHSMSCASSINSSELV